MTAVTVRPSSKPTHLPALLQVVLTTITAFAGWCGFRVAQFSAAYEQPCGTALMALWILTLFVGSGALLIAAFDLRALDRESTPAIGKYWARTRLLAAGAAMVAVAIALVAG